MATLVQPSPTPPPSRHSAHPLSAGVSVRPSSSSSSNTLQSPRTVSAQLLSSSSSTSPSSQMYPSHTQQQFRDSQSPNAYVAQQGYDFTRLTYQQQQAAKQHAQQRRQSQHLQHPHSSGQQSMMQHTHHPYTRQQQQVYTRRSEQDLREIAQRQSNGQQEMQSASIQPQRQMEAQSAPRPVTSSGISSGSSASGMRLSAGLALPAPPKVLGLQQRPSSADGSRSSGSATEMYRGRNMEQGGRNTGNGRMYVGNGSMSSRGDMSMGGRGMEHGMLVGLPPPPALTHHYGLHPRYSAEDVSTLKNMGYQPSPMQQHHSYRHQQHPQQAYMQFHQPAYPNQQVHSNHSSRSMSSGSGGVPPGFQQRPATSSGSGAIPSTYQPKPPSSSSPQQTYTQPSYSNPPSPIPSQIPALPAPQSPRHSQPTIRQRQSSLPAQQSPRSPHEPRSSRVLSPPPPPQPLIKRSSSSPELSPPTGGFALHRKSSSSSSTTSAASAPSALETASSNSSNSSHSSIPPTPPSPLDEIQPLPGQSQHTPIIPSPLSRPSIESTSLSPSPEPSLTTSSQNSPHTSPRKVYTAPPPAQPEPKRSLSARLRRALSFSSASSVSTTPNGLLTSTSTPDLHGSSRQGLEEEGVDKTDTVSISSTASSASVMLRKMSQGFKKSRNSIIGIFKGASRKPRITIEDDEEASENKFPFGVPEEEESGGNGASVGISYATAEGEISGAKGRESEDGRRRKSMVFGERESMRKVPIRRTESAPSVPIRGILKHSDSRQNSFEMGTSTPNDSTDSIPSMKTTSSTNDSQPISDFAKSLVSTLDSQFTLSRTSVDSQSPPTNLSDPSYFDLTPPGSISTRGGAATAPATPTGRTIGRKGIQFSPRLEVHETWHSAEYDRRGEPATCNRLTAQLAQMIKEELNAFKLEEMEVHEESRSYTHFF